jgi:hypothetical protein
MPNTEIDDIKAAVTKEVIETIEKRYFLIQQNALWKWLSGIMTFGVAVGIFSYKGALMALTGPSIDAATKAVIAAKNSIENDANKMHLIVEAKENDPNSASIQSKLDDINNKLNNKSGKLSLQVIPHEWKTLLPEKFPISAAQSNPKIHLIGAWMDTEFGRRTTLESKDGKPSQVTTSEVSW